MNLQKILHIQIKIILKYGRMNSKNTDAYFIKSYSLAIKAKITASEYLLV